MANGSDLSDCMSIKKTRCNRRHNGKVGDIGQSKVVGDTGQSMVVGDTGQSMVVGDTGQLPACGTMMIDDA
jgi:hypothetical protein